MSTRLPNHRLVKLHRSYTVEEIATLFGMHRNTIRNWIKDGLGILDDRRPVLVQGQVLIDFLTQRRRRNKRPCGPGRIYCLRCRIPKVPSGGWVTYQSQDSRRGKLIGVCPDCGTRLFRQVSMAKLPASLGDLKLRKATVGEHIAKSPNPIVNCDFNQGDAHRV